MQEREDLSSGGVECVDHDHRNRSLADREPTHLVEGHVARSQDEDPEVLDGFHPRFEGFVSLAPRELNSERHLQGPPGPSGRFLRVASKIGNRDRDLDRFILRLKKFGGDGLLVERTPIDLVERTTQCVIRQPRQAPEVARGSHSQAAGPTGRRPLEDADRAGQGHAAWPRSVQPRPPPTPAHAPRTHRRARAASAMEAPMLSRAHLRTLGVMGARSVATIVTGLSGRGRSYETPETKNEVAGAADLIPDSPRSSATICDARQHPQLMTLDLVGRLCRPVGGSLRCCQR